MADEVGLSVEGYRYRDALDIHEYGLYIQKPFSDTLN
jgi:hypothetical protein